MMVPARHFEKTIAYPKNANLDQRIDMLSAVFSEKADRVALAVANEVLFIRLHAHLQPLFPNARITFGMGSDTYRKLLASRSYFERAGIPWTNADEANLTALLKRCIVFGRCEMKPGYVKVPETIARVSSTGARDAVSRLRKAKTPITADQTAMSDLLHPDTVSYIAAAGLYP
jgi:hypothetical protein